MGKMMPSQIAIVGSLRAGLAPTLGTIVIHGFVVHTIVMTVRQNLQRGVLGMRIWVNLTFRNGRNAACACRASRGDRALGVRARCIWRGHQFQRGHLFIGCSYTTVGSDIVLPPQWKLLGPFEAVDGMLMFGVSTAFIFAVIQRLIHAGFDGADKFLP
jgi:hypothetical protein